MSQNVIDEDIGQCRRRLCACTTTKELNYNRLFSEPPIVVYREKHVMLRIISAAAI